MARFAAFLVHYLGKAEHQRMADEAMTYLAIPEIAKRKPTGGVLLANWEVNLANESHE